MVKPDVEEGRERIQVGHSDSLVSSSPESTLVTRAYSWVHGLLSLDKPFGTAALLFLEHQSTGIRRIFCQQEAQQHPTQVLESCGNMTLQCLQNNR